jgi:hypothetical protein
MKKQLLISLFCLCLICSISTTYAEQPRTIENMSYNDSAYNDGWTFAMQNEEKIFCHALSDFVNPNWEQSYSDNYVKGIDDYMMYGDPNCYVGNYTQAKEELMQHVPVYETNITQNRTGYFVEGRTFFTWDQAVFVELQTKRSFVVYHELGHVLNPNWNEVQCNIYSCARLENLTYN